MNYKVFFINNVSKDEGEFKRLERERMVLDDASRIHALETEGKEYDACHHICATFSARRIRRDIPYIVQVIETINMDKLSLCSVLAVLRYTNRYREKVESWNEYYKRAIELIDELGLDANKELYGIESPDQRKESEQIGYCDVRK